MSQPFLWRRVNDSSGFAEPRVFIRVYLEPGSIDAAIAFYEDLQGVAHDMRFDFPEKRLTLAAVGAFLLLEGSDEALAPFRSTTGTLLVDDIEPYHRRLLAAGAQIIFGPARAYRRLLQCAAAGRHGGRVRPPPAAAGRGLNLSRRAGRRNRPWQRRSPVRRGPAALRWRRGYRGLPCSG